MDFSDALSGFIGRNIEVFQAAQFIAGRLVAVTEGTFAVQTDASIYATAAVQVNVVIENTEFVRILPA